MKRLPLLPSILLAMLVLAARSSAIVLNWGSLPSGQSWTDGATSGSFNTDAANPGNDITISAVATGVSWTSGFPKNAADDGQSVVGNNDASTLHLRTPTFNNHTSTITVTITFNYTAGVNNVSFTLIDIDATTSGTGWIDGIKSVSATTVSNTQIAMNATSANTSVTTVSGSGTLGMTVVGLTAAGNITDHSGDVTFTSGTTAIKSITFTWYNPTGGELGGQVIALGNISYTPVPEVGSSVGSLALCGGLLAFWRRRRVAAGAAEA
jgi:hypothetical protein